MKRIHQRRNEITEYINSRGAVSFVELKHRFSDVSEMTLRTDLKELDREKRIERFHGGARAVQEIARSDDLFFLRASRNLEKRQQIARKAASFLENELKKKPDLAIYMDCGVTIEEICKQFPDEWCTIITNSISTAYTLSALKKPSITLLGGQVNKYNCSCESVKNFELIDRMYFDYAIIPTAGYDPSVGFTCGKEVVDEIRWPILEHSNKIIVPFDSSKVGRVYPMIHAREKDVFMVITDDNLPKVVRDNFISCGITVL